MKPLRTHELAYPAGGLVPRLASGSRWTCVLESGVAGSGRHAAAARWSFVLWNPSWVIEWTRRAGWTSRVGRSASGLPADPWEGLEAALASHGAADAPDDSPLRRGAAGWLAYELASTLERLPALERHDPGVPLARWAFADTIVALDHRERRARVLASGEHADEHLEEVIHAWNEAERVPAATSPPPLALDEERGREVEASLDRQSYGDRFEQVHALLRAGHIYQANLTIGFSARAVPEPWALHDTLRRGNPGPYAAHLGGEETQVVSASPELFLARRGRTLTTRPIKGTRPRGATPEADERLARELIASAKDRAEHVMIVDVHRNDLGRVAEYGSVAVTEPWALESFPTVHHLTSTIVGEERAGARPLDVVRASFPAGSITGAPKIRAMEVLAELEPHARGVYTGALGWLDGSGDFELAVAIRTITVHPDRVEFPAGGGIVLDSQCDAEYDEAWIKARALWAAVERSAAVARGATPDAPAASATTRRT